MRRIVGEIEQFLGYTVRVFLEVDGLQELLEEDSFYMRSGAEKWMEATVDRYVALNGLRDGSRSRIVSSMSVELGD